MGVMFGRRAVAEEPVKRALTLPWPSSPVVNFAGVDANSTMALQSVAIGSAIDLIASKVAGMPAHVFRQETIDGRTVPRMLTTPGNITHPDGDEAYGLRDWIYQAIVSLLYRGNLYGVEVGWDSSGRARQIRWLHPDDVRATEVDGGVKWWHKGQPISRPDLFVHHRGYPQPGRLLGLSPIEMHQLQIGVNLAATSYGDRWFRDGAHPSGMLTNSEADLSAEQATTAKQRFMGMFRGTREPVVLGRGWDWKQLQITPNESQFLQTQEWSAAECARMYGPGVAEMLGYKSGGTMTYSNVVERRADFVVLTLDRWIVQIEDILTGLLPRPQYVRLDRDALLRATTVTRYAAHESARRAGWKTVNEIRDDEDLPPLPGGDELGPPSAQPPQPDQEDAA